jgi:hypothetical protein
MPLCVKPTLFSIRFRGCKSFTNMQQPPESCDFGGRPGFFHQVALLPPWSKVLSAISAQLQGTYPRKASEVWARRYLPTSPLSTLTPVQKSHPVVAFGRYRNCRT